MFKKNKDKYNPYKVLIGLPAAGDSNYICFSNLAGHWLTGFTDPTYIWFPYEYTL